MSMETAMKYKPYPAYKDSGVEWLGEVPEHWTLKALKWETPIFRGASPRPIDDPIYFDDDGDYAWVRISDVTAAGMYLTKTEQRLSKLGSSLSVKLEPGSFFLSIAGSVGKPCITTIKCCIHDGFVYFPWWKGDNKFLFYLFASGGPYKGLGKFGTQLNLNTDTVGSIVVGLPSHQEQSIITAFLDRETNKIDTLIAKQERLIELLGEKRTALISHAVTKGLNPDAPMKDSGVEWLGEVPEHWEVSRAKFVSDVFVPQRNKPELNDTEGYLWITMDEMTSEIISVSQYRVSDNAVVNAGSKVLPSGSVIASCVGTFGVTSINRVPVIINQQLQAFIPRKISARYLSKIIIASRAYFEMVGTAATLVYVNRERFADMPVLCPSLDEQEQIIDYLVRANFKIDSLIAKSRQSIDLLKERRTALISAAVTGKIDVREVFPSVTPE